LGNKEIWQQWRYMKSSVYRFLKQSYFGHVAHRESEQFPVPVLKDKQHHRSAKYADIKHCMEQDY